jgi:hypothetical protein
MKGIIFTSFIEFAENAFGLDFVDEMLSSSELSTGGAYTNVGTYPASELLSMLDFVNRRKEVDGSAMQVEFGRFTFGHLVDRYPRLVKNFSNSFECIYEVDQTIHKDVRKLYPEAELPNLDARLDSSSGALVLDYHSSRPFMLVALGLLEGCVRFYGDSVSIEMTDLSEGAGNHARFVLNRND